MKKVKIVSVILLLVLGYVACKKSEVSGNISLETSKSASIMKGEPVVFTLSKVTSDTVRWDVSPSTNIQVNESGNQASILFGTEGKYVITANSRGVFASTTVSVMDSVFNVDTVKGGGRPVADTTLPFYSGETIRIIASRLDSSAGSTGLLFSAKTTKKYPCLRNSLITSTSVDTNRIQINYSGVFIPAGCTTGTAKAGSFSYITPIAAGTRNITIKFNGKTYSGTIVRNGNKYTINWPYTTGVVISPTNL